MRSSHSRLMVLLALAATCLVPAAARAQGPPPPTSTNGNPVTTVASGVTTPTAFAFAGQTIFAASGPADGPNKGPTGVFTLADGKATRVPGTPSVVYGLTWHKGRLYVSTGRRIIAFSRWNGTRFQASKTVRIQRGKHFAGFNGLAFGPDGMLYAGVSFSGGKYDNKRDPAPYAQSVVRMKANGKRLRSIARGLRQPFQLTFVGHGRFPYVTVLSADTVPARKTPLDAIVVAKPGQDYGFPTCRFGTPSTCKGFPTPPILLAKHSSPMGIGAIGRTLYISLFGGIKGNGNAAVVKVRAGGGKVSPVLQGFVAPIVALGVHKGTIYVGDLTGTIYSVKA